MSYTQPWPPAVQYQPHQWAPTQYPQPAPVQQRPQFQQPVNNLLRVTGPESAKSFAAGPNSNVVMFHESEPVFYLKSTDDAGFASMRTFRYVEDEEPAGQAQPQVDMSQFATKDDLAGLQETLGQLQETLKGLM